MTKRISELIQNLFVMTFATKYGRFIYVLILADREATLKVLPVQRETHNTFTSLNNN